MKYPIEYPWLFIFHSDMRVGFLWVFVENCRDLGIGLRRKLYTRSHGG
jgi:hypothetical protein